MQVFGICDRKEYKYFVYIYVFVCVYIYALAFHSSVLKNMEIKGEKKKGRKRF